MEHQHPDRHGQEEEETPRVEPLHLEADTSALYEKPTAEGHVWKQRGVYLECRSCSRVHAVSITAFGGKPGDILTGFKEGKPIFKTP